MKQVEALRRTELAEVFRVTTRTITRWAADGMPRRGDNRFNLSDCIAWRIEQAEKAGQIASKEAGESPEASKWLERYRRERALLARMERKERQGGLIRRDRVVKEYAERAADLRTTFRSYKFRLGAILEGKTCEEIMQILADENDRMLRAWCEARRFLDPGEIPAGEKEPEADAARVSRTFKPAPKAKNKNKRRIKT